MNPSEHLDDLHGCRVVVVDDNKAMLRVAGALLERAGCHVCTAEDGFQALSRIMDHRPQIIFTESTLPRLDGYQMCAVVKHSALFRDTPVIMFRGKDGGFDERAGRKAGVDQYLFKPYSCEDLLEVIRNKVENAHGDSEAGPVA